jgi:cytochrome oxidase Cu insertion factor (SCO1/SenC/PrrC family)
VEERVSTTDHRHDRGSVRAGLPLVGHAPAEALQTPGRPVRIDRGGSALIGLTVLSVDRFQEVTAMRKTLWAMALIALVAAPAWAGPGKYNKVIGPGDKAPTFSGLPAVIGDQDTSLSFDDIKEDAVVLVFLANHCPWVTRVEDRVIDLANEYKGKNVRVVAVCVTPLPDAVPEGYNKAYSEKDTMDKIRERVKEKKYNFVYGRDDTQKIGREYGAVATPVFFVLDKERKIRYTGLLDDNIADESKVTKRYVRDAVDAVLAGKPVEVEETRATGCGIGYRKAE